MPFIQNVSAKAIKKAEHCISDNCILIQIADTGAEFPVPKHKFINIYQYQFLDIEDTDEQFTDECKISYKQAIELVDILAHALANNINIVVHCVAGICRSGAVCEVGIMMGFEDTGRLRIPNLSVKYKMMKVLGFTYR